MAKNRKSIVPYRRKREGKTNYKKRLALIKSNLPRLVIRKTNKKIIIQLIEYHPEGDKVLVSATSDELKKYGWKGSLKNCPAFYLMGIIIAKKMISENQKNCVPDLGMYNIIMKSNLFSFLAGVKEGGIDIHLDEKAVPDKNRIEGSHISEDVVKNFNDVKISILKS